MSSLPFDPQNLTRSCHEALILSALASGARHGYQLALEIEERSESYFRFHHGTLYPILHKLEKGGLISGAWSKGEPGRKKKSYSLTARGRGHLEEQRSAWNVFFGRFREAVEGGES